jgi:2-C-methyl-D-erythritol 4-phosphate cytidylyltransferase
MCCIVPAAGIGKRMQANVPKQYLPFRTSTILDHTLKRLLSCELIEKVIVVTNNDDHHWPSSSFFEDPRVTQVVGGKERSDSVLNGLLAAEALYGKDVWVLVHDAARPCIVKEDIQLLIEKATTTDQGTILAAPIHDTIKKVSDSSLKTLDRNKIWRALTPQMFRLRQLKNAITNARGTKKAVTDEAHAVELTGDPTGFVEGRSDNVKITTSSDLSLANYYIDRQEGAKCE